MKKHLYIIAGPNGAGKTTASYTFLPDIFECFEFVNADEIAKGLSPFKPESVGLQAGRLMINRIRELLDKNESFAFETTLATKSYASLIRQAKQKDYEVTLMFFMLESKELAIERVKTRVAEGGHNIPTEVIKRRYDNGLTNLFNRYIQLVDQWLLIDNSDEPSKIIAQGNHEGIDIKDKTTWNTLNQNYHGK